ncbi:MAG: Rrf2 family transcriptional regulator [Kiritimatiellia bacterium]
MINVSTKGRYAVRIMVNLARVPGGEAKSARIIGEEEGISADYVEQLLVKLRGLGFVKSRRGKRGGAMLAGPADRIRVADLLAVIEGEVCLAPCITGACEREGRCPARKLWQEANDAIERVFESASIADLAQGKGTETLSFQI